MNLVKEAYVEGLGEVDYVVAPLDKSLHTLKDESYRLINARDLAFARIQKGKEHAISKIGSWIKEGVLYLPQPNKIVLVRSSPVLRSPAKATEAHRQRKEFFISDKAANQYLKRIKANTASVHVLKNRGSIPTNSFGRTKDTRA